MKINLLENEMLKFKPYICFDELIEKWADETFSYRYPSSFAEELEEALAAHKKNAYDCDKENRRQINKIMDLKHRLVELTEGTDEQINWDDL